MWRRERTRQYYYLVTVAWRAELVCSERYATTIFLRIAAFIGKFRRD
jgi:hypothetical protein